MVLFWDFSPFRSFHVKSSYGSKTCRSTSPSACVETWRLALLQYLQAANWGCVLSAPALRTPWVGCQNHPELPGPQACAAGTPAHWSLAPLRDGEGTCSPRWKRCQTASCGKDPSSAAQLGFTSADFLCLIFVLSFFFTLERLHCTNF